MSNLTAIPPNERDHIPVIPPPAGVSSNLVNPPNHGPQLLVAATFLLGFTVFFFAFRVYAKLFLARKVWWDDLTCVLAFIGTLIIYGCFVYDVFEGPNGKHLWDVSVAAMLNEQYSITAYIYQVTFSPANYFIKLSIFLLYLQLFWPNKWIRILVYSGIAFTTAFYAAITIVITYLLTPKGDGQAFSVHMWSIEQKKALILFVPIAVVGLIIDLFLLVLPMKPVIGLEISWKRKCGVLFVFMSGIFATVGSSCSIYYRVKIARTMDTTWYFAYAQIMTLIELLGGIICVCLPSVSKTLRHHSRHFESLFRRHPAPLRACHLTGDNDRRYQTRQRTLNTDKERRPTIGTVRLQTLRNKNVARMGGNDRGNYSECYRPKSYATEDSRRHLLVTHALSIPDSSARTDTSSDKLGLTRSDRSFATSGTGSDKTEPRRSAGSYARTETSIDRLGLTRSEGSCAMSESSRDKSNLTRDEASCTTTERLNDPYLTGSGVGYTTNERSSDPYDLTLSGGYYTPTESSSDPFDLPRNEGSYATERSSDNSNLRRSKASYTTTETSYDMFDLTRGSGSYTITESSRDPFDLTRRDSIV